MDRRTLPVPAPHHEHAIDAYGYSYEREESVISPRQVWSMLWAHRGKTLLIAASVILLTGATALLMPRTYAATATLMVNFDVYDPLGDREFPMGLLGSYMATQVELASGPGVLKPVVERLRLTEDEDYTAGYSGSPEGLSVWVAERLSKRLTVEQGGFGSQLIYVSYLAPTAEEAAEVANTVAEVYAEQQYQRQTGPASERASRYAEQLAELKAKVNEAQNSVTSYRQNSGLIDSDMAGDVNLQLLTTLEHRLQEIQQVRRVAASKVAADQAVGQEVLGSTMIQSLKTRLREHESRMAELRATHGARHPDVQALQAQIGVTRRALDAEQGAYSRSARAELVAARALEQQLLAAVAEQRETVAKVRDLQDEGAGLELALSSAESVYKRALEGYDQVMFAATGGYSNVEIASRASPPSVASKPRVGLMLLMGVVGGLALGVLLPLFYELLNRRIRCRDDIERDHGIPVLGELGSVRGDGDRWEPHHG